MMGFSGPTLAAMFKAKSVAFKIYELIDKLPEIDSLSKEGLKPDSVAEEKHEIEFRNVHFTYPSRPNEKILNDISFTVKEGQSLALVGTSGSGKSTCIALLQRFYDVAEGGIFFNGHDIRELNVRWWRQKM